LLATTRLFFVTTAYPRCSTASGLSAVRRFSLQPRRSEFKTVSLRGVSPAAQFIHALAVGLHTA
jgi:hypothetical protein